MPGFTVVGYTRPSYMKPSTVNSLAIQGLESLSNCRVSGPLVLHASSILSDSLVLHASFIWGGGFRDYRVYKGLWGYCLGSEV